MLKNILSFPLDPLRRPHKVSSHDTSYDYKVHHCSLENQATSNQTTPLKSVRSYNLQWLTTKDRSINLPVTLMSFLLMTSRRRYFIIALLQSPICTLSRYNCEISSVIMPQVHLRHVVGSVGNVLLPQCSELYGSFMVKILFRLHCSL